MRTVPARPTLDVVTFVALSSNAKIENSMSIVQQPAGGSVINLLTPNSNMTFVQQSRGDQKI